MEKVSKTGDFSFKGIGNKLKFDRLFRKSNMQERFF